MRCGTAGPCYFNGCKEVFSGTKRKNAFPRIDGNACKDDAVGKAVLCLVIADLPDGEFPCAAVVYGEIVTLVLFKWLQLMDAPGVESQGEMLGGLSCRCGCPASLHPFPVALVGSKRELFGVVAPKETCAFVYCACRYFDDGFILATLARGAVEFRSGVADDAGNAVVVRFKPIIVADGFAFGIEVGMGKGDAVSKGEGTLHAHAFGGGEGAVVDHIFLHAVL